jgi:hypothetical protein
MKRLIAPIALAAALLLPAAAHAEWHFTKRGAEKVAADYVSKRYADTYVEDLTTACRPQGMAKGDPRFKYHRWVCGWYDASSDMSGQVLVIGSSGRGLYYGQVMRGALQR